MKRENLRASADYYTGKVSEITRQLGFVGIAVIWIFKTGSEPSPNLPNKLLIAAILIILSLALDLIQYIVASIIWSGYNRIKEKKLVSEEDNFDAPRFINLPAIVLFWTKTVFMVIAYAFIIIFLILLFTSYESNAPKPLALLNLFFNFLVIN